MYCNYIKIKNCLFKILLYVNFKKYIWNITSMNQKVSSRNFSCTLEILCIKEIINIKFLNVLKLYSYLWFVHV